MSLENQGDIQRGVTGTNWEALIPATAKEPETAVSQDLAASAPASVKKTVMQRLKGMLPNMKRVCPSPNSEADTAERTSFIKSLVRSVKVGKNSQGKANKLLGIESPKASKVLGSDTKLIDLKDVSALENIQKQCAKKLPIKNRFDGVAASLSSYTARVKEGKENLTSETLYLLSEITSYQDKVKGEKRTGLDATRDEQIALLKESLLESFTKEFPKDKVFIAKGALEQLASGIASKDDQILESAIVEFVSTIKQHAPDSKTLIPLWKDTLNNETKFINANKKKTAELKDIKEKLDKLNVKYDKNTSLSNAKALLELKGITNELDRLNVKYNKNISVSDAKSLIESKKLNDIKEKMYSLKIAFSKDVSLKDAEDLIDAHQLSNVKVKLDEMGIEYDEDVSLKEALSLFVSTAFTQQNIPYLISKFFNGPPEKIETLYETYKAADAVDQFMYYSLSYAIKPENQISPEATSKLFDIIIKELKNQKAEINKGGVIAGGETREVSNAKIDRMISQMEATKLMKADDFNQAAPIVLKGLHVDLLKDKGLFQMNFGEPVLAEFEKGMTKEDNASTISQFDDMMLTLSSSNKDNYKRINDTVKIKFLESCEGISFKK